MKSSQPYVYAIVYLVIVIALILASILGPKTPFIP
jgi:hypothetical protein